MESYNFYAINLESCKDRWNTMVKLYDDKLIRVNAYDGQKLKEYEDIHFDSLNLSPNEIACSFSHIKAIKTAYENGDEEAFIIEDDMVNTYKDYWKQSLRNYVENKPHNCECLIFYTSNPRKLDTMLKSTDIYFEYGEDHWSTGCYYLTKAAMKKIYDLYIVNEIIDFSKLSWFDVTADGNLIFPRLQTYHVSHPTFIDTCLTSTIHPDHLAKHRVNHDRMKNYFEQIEQGGSRE